MTGGLTIPSLVINESGTGNIPTQTIGSIILKHQLQDGVSSIVFPSPVSGSGKYGYIRYFDNTTLQSGRLEIGIQNNESQDKIYIKTPNGNGTLTLNGHMDCGIVNATELNSLCYNLAFQLILSSGYVKGSNLSFQNNLNLQFTSSISLPSSTYGSPFFGINYPSKNYTMHQCVNPMVVKDYTSIITETFTVQLEFPIPQEILLDVATTNASFTLPYANLTIGNENRSAIPCRFYVRQMRNGQSWNFRTYSGSLPSGATGGTVYNADNTVMSSSNGVYTMTSYYVTILYYNGNWYVNPL